VDLHSGILDFGQNFREVLSGNHNHRSGSFFTAPLMYCWAKQIKAKKILEVGVGSGGASYWLGHAAQELDGKYFGIELHEGRVKALSELMDTFKINHQIWAMDSLKMTDEFIGKHIGRIDLAYLDGNHNLESIWHEITTIWPYLRINGYVFIHDIHSVSKEGWAKVKSEFEETFEIFGNSGTGVVRKLAEKRK